MFNDKTLEAAKKLQEQWDQTVAEIYKGKQFTAKTSSGIPIKPVYTPLDIKDIDYIEDISMPGSYPYMRSNYPIHYQYQPWINQPVHGYGLPEDTKERMDALTKAGMEGYFGGRAYNLVWDYPGYFGIDPDEPDAEGYIGKDGVSCNTDEDLDRMLGGLDLAKNSIILINGDTLPIFSIYIAYAESKGVPRANLRGNTMNWVFTVWYAPNFMWETEDALKLATDNIHFCVNEIPRWNHTNIQGHAISETGADAVHQMGFCLGTAIAVSDSCKAAGLDPDKFLTGIGFQIAQCNDFFEYICMFRAWRKLWAQIARERYGATRPAAMHLRTHTNTSCFELIKQQPLNNIIRSAYHAMGAALSGTTAMQVPAFDEPIGIPTEESAVLTLRTQQILLHETGVTRVSDPLAGSYYVEWLTHQMEQEGRRILKEIEDAGGFVKAHKDGMLAKVLRRNCDLWREEIETGKRIVVGWNKYQMEETQKVKAFRPDPEVARISVERIKDYKARRDQAKTDAALNGVLAATEKLKKGEYGHVMPACVEAAKAKATAGEISKALRKVMRWGPEYNVMLKY
ncbi:MAG: acyl-CoA mutase large subunit family protein [Dehalococcoidia bacterium]|nr:acyl-CoA mutase large subunit family protein [Dehalococcoidia bacterium]